MMNSFRLIGDLIHLFAIIFLLVNILVTRSAVGISGKSQLLYALVYTTRYIDVFTTYISLYNTSFKILFIVLSYVICFLIHGKYSKTYDYKNDTFHYEFLLLGCAVLGCMFNYQVTPTEILWTFSVYLEAVALIPQFFMMKKIPEKDKSVLFYLMMMFLYRLFYIFNWIYRYYFEGYNDPISIMGGTVQVMLHWEFVHVYIMNVIELCTDFVTLLVLLATQKSIKGAIVACKTDGEEYTKVEAGEYVTKDSPIYTVKC